MEDPTPPPGISLRDPEDSDSIRADIENSVIGALDRYVNGYSYGGVRLELKNLRFADKEKFSLKEQNEAMLNDRLLHRRLRGDIHLVDETTNKVIDKRPGMTLARVPWLTQRGTFINNGSEFSPVMQSRLLPGAYTRRRDNGELETHFNVRPGTGSAMRVTFDPSTAQYRLKVGTSDLHAYSVFKDLGVTDDELERRWGKEILEANKSNYSRHTLERLYNKAIPRWERDPKLDPLQKAQAIRDSLQRAQVAESILKQNLPNLYSQEKAAHWRRMGRAVQAMQEMVKRAAEKFAPDYSPGKIMDNWMSFEFGLEKAADVSQVTLKKEEFEPDLMPGDMKESYNSIYGRTGPQLASMRRWPSHWLDDQDNQGWLQWYENYHSGRRSDTDERQIKRWKSFKSRHGAQFVANPSPRRAFALMNWGIDPLKMLPMEKAEELKPQMEAYRRKEYVKWYMNRHDFDDDTAERLGKLAIARGADVTDVRPGPGELMSLALDGYIQPEDLK
jgi:hypothetical protein